MTACICIVGNKNAGKTTLTEQLLPELIARGRKAATIKHDAHDFEIDMPGKDTWRHRQAGSSTTIIASSSKVAMVRLIDREEPLEGLLRLVDRSYDLVLIEGLRRSPLPKIVVYRPELGLEPPHVLGETWAVVTSGSNLAGIDAPHFLPGQVAELADLIEQRLLGGPAHAPAWNLPALLAEAGRQHGHLCPGQVLGVRMAVAGCDRLGIADPKSSKRLIVFVETDRCGTDAIQTVSGCTLGKRTLKFVDYGKLAATFVDTKTERAVRVSALESSRHAAQRFAPEESDRHQAQMRAYKALPDDELFTIEAVRVELSESDLPGRPRSRVICAICREGVNDGREETVGGHALCRACAGRPYYKAGTGAQRQETPHGR